ncbi:hypothetical protein Adt_10580 [Abeliophyllum distichum]|uniref:Nitrate regulatory gene2 protein-like n=1 Tax=Abeliophyllum distichum TaxID=126358 RepID=A0ABD1UKD3_9LAMI
MGCAQSRIDNEESVSRCKERRNLMKEAVSVRNAFASAQSGYAVSLKNTGAALSDYGAGEVPPPPPAAMAVGPRDTSVTEQPPPPPPPPPSMVESSLPPPPPPLPSFSPLPPIQRSMTMPAALSHSEKMKRKMKGIAIDESDGEEEEEEEKGGLNRRRKGVEEVGGPETPIRTPNPPPPPDLKGVAWDYFFMGDNMPGHSLDEAEEEEEEKENYMEGQKSNENGNFNNVGDDNIEFKTPEKSVGFQGVEEFKTPEEMPATKGKENQFMHSNTAPPGMSRGGIGGGNMVGNRSSVDLSKILGEIDDHFLKASQSAQEVSKLLEATRLHYHSNFADNRGHIDHAERVMQVITWNKSFKGVPNGDSTKDNVDADDYETHATVLDKLLAWEKKLYEEVKAGEHMKLEYQRKVSALNKLKKRNASPEQLEKAKAAVSHLHTRYIVDWQSLDSTVLEVNDIRDKQLYPKLVALVHGMAKKWESMCTHHDSQLNIVAQLKSLEVSGTLIETSKHHHERTIQLWNVVREWHSQLEKLVSNQRQYIQALNSWLKLNLIPIESSLKEKISSPPRVQNPPIQPLLISWHDQLEKHPDEVAKSAISSFAAVIKSIIDHQEEEMKLKEKYEETRKEYMRKNQAFQEWYQKYMQHRNPDETDPEKAVGSNTKDPLSEKQFVVESLKKRLGEEMEDHQKLCIQVRDKSLGSLKIRLPEFFRAMSEYAHACFDSYERLRLLTQSQHHVNRGS